MFSTIGKREGVRANNHQAMLPAAVGGLNTTDALGLLPPQDATILENFVPYPDRVEMRYGATNHVTGFASAVKSLLTYSGLTANSLWAATDSGIYDATVAGAVGAAAIALTNGYLNYSTLSTGGGMYLQAVNGVDDLVQYNGAAWSSVAAFGGLNTNTLIAVETYRQRFYYIQEASTKLWYLPVNSISGAAVEYDLGAIFRRGGTLKALATWTIDGGSGPDDHLVVVTSNGEVAVFVGSDPADAVNWFLKGVYYVGRPLGAKSLYKFGGDVLLMCESGVYPLSRALLTASIDRTQAVSKKISSYFTALSQLYGTLEGWEFLSIPSIPLLLVNVPGTTTGLQLAMHSENGSWCTFSGWTANCFERMGDEVFYGDSNRVVKAWTGSADFGNNIVSTLLQAPSRWGYPRTKLAKMLRSTFRANGTFDYTIGIANGFSSNATANLITTGSSGALWGSGIWGSSIWSASTGLTRDWRAVPDVSGTYKALYLQVASNSARAAHLSTDIVYSRMGTF